MTHVRPRTCTEWKAIFLLVLWILLIAARPGLSAPTRNSPNVEQIDAFVSQQVQGHGLPGLALALVEGDRVIFMKGYGKADQSGRPVTPQTPFVLASVSKPLTAAAIMQLVEAGKVELDAPLQRYVPDFRVADPVASGQITIRHLLLHTSGIPVTSCDTRIDATTLAQFVAELRTVSLDAPPGTRHNYCSGNYNLLGRVIETVSGQSYGSYMQQHVFAPLGMRQSFTTEPEALRAGMAQGYQWVFGLLVPTHPRFNPSQLPSGSLVSSAEDMTHFLIAQLNGGQYAGAALLNAGSIAAMQAPGVRRETSGEYGFGWVIAPLGGVPAVYHEGAGINTRALLLMEPGTRRGAVMLINAFGFVPAASAFPEIESGIAGLLAGQEPAPAPGMSLRVIYTIIDVLLAVLLAAVLWPLLNMRRWNHWLRERQQAGRLPKLRVTLRSAREIVFALIFLGVIQLVIMPNLGAQSWYELFTVVPDFVAWIWGIALIGLATGIIRLVLILQSGAFSGENRKRRPFSDPILTIAEK